MTGGQTSDEELLEQWRAGDSRAGDVLLRRHFVGLRSYFVSRFDDEDTVKDLVQETMMQAVKNRDKFRGESSFRTYLYGIARNMGRQRIQQRVREREKLDPAHDSIADVTGRRHSSILAEKDELRRLFDALRAIPMAAQERLELHYFQDLTAAELAELEGTNPSTAKSRLRIARQQLARKYWELAGEPVDRDDDDERFHEWMLAARASARRGELRQPDED